MFEPICDTHAPMVNIKVRENEPPWVTNELRPLCVDRDYYKKIAESSKSDGSKSSLYWSKLKSIRNRVNNLTCTLKKKVHRTIFR